MSDDTGPIEWSNPKSTIEQKAIEKQLAVIGRIFDEIFKQFLPADTIADADLHMSTTDIFNKVQDHYPSEVLTSELIHKLMQEAGYTFTTFENKIEFVWLLKRR